MNKTIRLIVALAIVMMATSACKTKQKIAEIPAGANIEAKSTPKVVETTPVVKEAVVKEVVSNEPEVTRNENFSLVDGESASMNYKYHVVVGSFSKQDNAKGLKTTLKAEGNNALIVVNEKGMYRVLIASFNDYKEAHARIKQISTRFPDAWVLVKK
ncbi:MAG: SPOR domain-containing protein [Paludibacter sp.]|nr:SPOR domain-containing protein [Paludibacter sp.]